VETLTWMFKLVDRMSGPAEAMGKGLVGLSGRLKVAGKGVAEFTGKVIDWTGKIGLAGHALRAVAEAAMRLGEGGLGLGKSIVEAEQFHRVTTAGLTAIEKSARVVAGAELALETMADNAGADIRPLVEQFKELRLAGFGTQDALDAIAASLSVAAVHGDKAGDAVYDLIKSIKANKQGLLDAGALESVTKAGIPTAHYKEALAKLKGVTVDQVESLVKGGQVSVDEGLAALLGTIHEKLDKEDGLGNAAKTLVGDSVAGQLQKFQNIFRRLFSEAGLSGPLVRALKALNELLGENSVTGKKLREIFAWLFGTVADLFEALAKGDTLEGVFGAVFAFFDAIGRVWTTIEPYLSELGGPLWEGIKEAVKPLVGLFARLFPAKGGPADPRLLAAFRDLGKVLGWLLGIAVDLGLLAIAVFGLLVTSLAVVIRAFHLFGQSIADAWDSFTSFFEDLWDGAVDLYDGAVEIAEGFIDGLIEGIENGWDTVVDTVMSLGDAVVGTVKKKLGIHSPSKVMASFGAFTAIGFAQGIESEAHQADTAMGNLVMPPSLVGSSGASGKAAAAGAMGPVTIGDIVVNVPADTTDPQAFGKAVGDGVREKLVSLLEELGLEAAA